MGISQVDWENCEEDHHIVRCLQYVMRVITPKQDRKDM